MRMIFFDRSTFYANHASNCLTAGDNLYGQLGVGDNEYKISPTPIIGLQNDEQVVHVARGYHHTMIITNTGRCLAAGNNEHGQLGVGDYGNKNTFTPITGVPPGNSVAQVVCGNEHTMIITNTGLCLAAGRNQEGQLGICNNDNKNTFTPITGVPSGNFVVQVACGMEYTMIITNTGLCLAAGANAVGQLGIGNNDDKNTFTPIAGVPPKNFVVQVVCSDKHTMLITRTGSCYAAGENFFGILGVGTWVGACNHKNTFTQVLGMGDKHVVQVMCNGSHAMIITNDGCCFATGYNDHGQLGVGDEEPRCSFSQVLGIDNEHVVQAASSITHSMIITSTGRCFMAGDNSQGQLGLGRGVRYVNSFTEVREIGNERVLQGICVLWCTVILTSNGRWLMAGLSRGGGNNYTFRSIEGMPTNMGTDRLENLAINKAVAQYGFGQELYDRLGENTLKQIATHYNLVVCQSQRTLRPRASNEPFYPGVRCRCPRCLTDRPNQ